MTPDASHTDRQPSAMDLRTVSAEERAAQVRMLYQAIPQTVWGTLANLVILLIVQWTVIDHRILFTWALALGVITSARTVLAYQYRKVNPAAAHAPLWERRFVLGSSVAGLAWGSTAVLLFPLENHTHQVFLVLVLLAVNAGATTNLSYRRAPIFIYLLFCLTPVILQFFTLESATTTAIGAVVTIYLFHLLVSSNRIYKNALQTIRLNHQAREREAVLEKTLQKQELHVSQTPLGVIEWDTEFRVSDWNPAAESIFGYTKEEVLGKRAVDIIIPASVKPHVDAIWQGLLRLEGGLRSRNENVTKDGRTIICEWYNTPLVEKDGSVVGVASMVEDVTQKAHAEEQLFQEKERAQITLNSITDGVLTIDAEGRIEYMNQTAEQMTGWGNAEAEGRELADIFQVIDKRSGQTIKNPFQRCLNEGTVVGEGKEGNLIRRDGQLIPIEDTAAPLHNREGRLIGAVLVFRDISNSDELRNQLSYQASHDSTTGLKNRRKFERLLLDAITQARQRQQEHVFFYMDLDQFKIINDTCGHLAGDELLRQLSAVLKSHMRASDSLARLGGDEFGVLLENCPLEKAQAIANNLRKAVREFRFTWMEKMFEVGVSIGVVGINKDSGDLTDILSAADMACYRAKELGRNRIQIYNPADMDIAQHRGEMQYVSQIKKALEEDRLCLYAQAIRPVWTTPIVTDHYEILVRMLDEQGQLVQPGQFLPAAERYNLMPAIDRWVIEHLFAGYRTFNCGALACRFSINLSGTTLNDDDILAFIHGQFQKHQVPPENITFEITETAAVENLTKAAHFINDLKAIGCRFSLDDFGSGVSSFAYLKNLPVDYLKIDGSFVKDMVDDPIDWAMVEAITKIGHVMGLQTIAEFVETDAILKELRKIGVDFAQGYGIGKPAPLGNIMQSAPKPPRDQAYQQ
jgi:diguanylate cyclase (GGDEF)-like protein/PAS domain S-box-containing protein